MGANRFTPLPGAKSCRRTINHDNPFCGIFFFEREGLEDDIMLQMIGSGGQQGVAAFCWVI